MTIKTFKTKLIFKQIRCGEERENRTSSKQILFQYLMYVNNPT